MSVYFVASMDMQRVKIGKANNLQTRFGDLLRMSPYPLLLLADIVGSRYVERSLHRRFAQTRLHGEWFMTSPELEELVGDIQATGPLWTVMHLPLELKADGIDINGHGLRGRGRYSAQDQLNQVWVTNGNKPAIETTTEDQDLTLNLRNR